jgi:hypothetical protein
MKTMKLLTTSIQESIIELLPDQFALVFDAWKMNQTHLLGFFATFPSPNVSIRYEEVLLCFSPVTNEDILGTTAQIEFSILF